MDVLFWITVGVGAVWIAMFVRSLFDLRATPRVRREDAAGAQPLPRVSVIVPARNEEANIEACLRSLLAGVHPDLEIMVVDDGSTDATAEIVRRMGREDPRVRLVGAGELPAGWTGKCHALHQGVCAGPTGEWLLFVDADTVHAPESVAAALRTALQLDVDFLTLIPHLGAASFWEKLMQPTVAALIALFKKPARINDPGCAEVFANGQYMLVRRAVYERCGGHQAVRGKVLEDFELARSLTRAGGRVYVAIGRDLFTTRMYTNLRSLMEGWTKNFYMILESQLARVLAASLTAVVLSLWPAATGLVALADLAAGWHLWQPHQAWIVLGVYAAVLVFQATLRGLNRWYPAYAVLAPLANLVAVFILVRSAWLHRRGRSVSWKGRSIVDDRGDKK